MKTLISIGVLISFSAGFSAGEELPSDVQQLVSKRDEAVAKIDRTFVDELEKLKVKYTKAGDLKKANLVQALIDQKQSQPSGDANLSAREILVSSPWTIMGDGDSKASYEVSFGKDGVATRLDTKQKWWKWEIDGNILWCRWFSSGWVKFEINDDPKQKVWKGRNAGGARYTMTISSPK